MKTPKRDAVDLSGINHIHVPLLRRQIHSRWKRKNRIKQLKHTITRQKREIKYLREMINDIGWVVDVIKKDTSGILFLPNPYHKQ